ncbi:hypothetical protein C9J60_23630 [Streptomyces sp. A244]|nr:hypothetical protein C9J60_23630 [Streptomyces sp. A244]
MARALITELDPGERCNVAPYASSLPCSGEPPLTAVTVAYSGRTIPEPGETRLSVERTGESSVASSDRQPSPPRAPRA